MQNTAINPLKDQLLQFADPRLQRGRKHELIDVLMIAITALICGAENFTHMAQFGKAKESWLRTFLTLSNGILSHDTFRRVFMLLSPEKFSAVFLSWTQSLRQAVGAEVVALDGKTVRRSFDSAKGQSAIHLVSAWASMNRLVLGQIKVDDKSNEITAVPELLRALELAGCIVTVDALNCQKTIAKEIKEADADYVMALKGNHGTAHEEIKIGCSGAGNPRPQTARDETLRAGRDPGCAGNGGQRAWSCGDAPLLSEREPGLVCRPSCVEGITNGGDGGSATGNPRQVEHGTALLFVEPAAGGENLCASGARTLGRGEPTALGVGRADERGSKPRPHGTRR